MRRTKEQPIGTLLRQYLRDEGLETPLNQYRLIQQWKEIMGEGIMQYTGDMFIKNQTLFVKITSPALRSELMMTRTSLVQKLNTATGAIVIADINFF